MNMLFDPNEVAAARIRAAEARLAAKRTIRRDRSTERSELEEKIKQAQEDLEAYDRETADQVAVVLVKLDRDREWEEMRAEHKAAIAAATKEYNQAIIDGAPIIKAADPRPGKMGEEAERAQNRIMSAFSDLMELGGGGPDEIGH
jgi:hypothetical protein